MAEEEKQAPQRQQFAPGWYRDMSNEDYHGSSGYSSSVLKMINEMPYSKMQHKRQHPTPPSDAMQLGTLVHTLALEPEQYEKEYIIKPEGLKKPTSTQYNAKKPTDKTLRQIKDWETWQAELLESGKKEIMQSRLDAATAMAEKLKNDPEVGCFFDKKMGGISEQSLFYWYNPEDWDDERDYRIMCKVRPDLVVPGHSVLFDLKTTRDASFSEFMYQIKNRSYHLSAAMYLDGANRNKEFCDAMGVLAFTGFAVICVENEPPYEVASYQFSPDDLDAGKNLYHKAVRRIWEYNRSDWKGYGALNSKTQQIEPVTRITELPNFRNNIV